MELTDTSRYAAFGVDEQALAGLGLLGDLLLSAGFNVTAVSEPGEVERLHFLDSLSLLTLPCVRSAQRIVDIGSGAGVPGLILAIVLNIEVVTVESQRKKAAFIEGAARALRLDNAHVRCVRAEDYGRSEGRGRHDVAVSRALAALPVVAEYSMPLLVSGGSMVAMKGAISDEELIRGRRALGILGGEAPTAVRLEPFPDATNRWAYVSRKVGPTPAGFPRRPGIPVKRPLGSHTSTQGLRPE